MRTFFQVLEQNSLK